MKRRAFMGRAAATAAALSTGALSATAFGAPSSSEPGRRTDSFNLKYAPHFGMFRNSAGEDLLDQLQFMHDVGFRAMEDNGMKNREVAMQEKIASKMANLGMDMGVFVAHSIDWKKATLSTGDLDIRRVFLKQIEESVEVARRVNATWMTVVCGHVDLRLNHDFQTANVVESLKQASAILEPHGLIMVLEPLNFYNHPGLFLKEIPQAYQVCKAVGSPSCKILDDLYHQQIQEGNLIPNMDDAWEEIAYFQVGDNPGRKEPTTGEINYLNVFRHIHEKGYTGIVGMEHGNSIKGKEGEEAVIKAYTSVDQF